VKEGEASIESKKGNTITKAAKPNDPAVHVTRPGNDVVKNASELEVEEPKTSGASDDIEKTDAPEVEDLRDEDNKVEDAEEKPAGNGDAQTGGKREHAETEANGNGAEEINEDADKPAEAAAEPEEKEDDEPPAKKQKKDNPASSEVKDGEGTKKGRGRPKKADSNGTSTKGPTKKKEPKKAATETGEPRRSGRNSSISK
jgi:hypothetical protein